MIVHIKGIAVNGPGFGSWAELRNHLVAGTDLTHDPQLPPQGTILSGAERRRASPTIKLAVDVAQAALLSSGMDAEDLALVFASSNGDTLTIHQLCEALATPERLVSPTRFHNSVHNAPAGYWSIASGSRQPSSSICAGDDSFAAGLVEATSQCLTEDVPVLLVTVDLPFPEPLYEKTPGHQPFGVALVLDSHAEGSYAQMTISIAKSTPMDVTSMTDPVLENLRCDSSASRSLPLLAALAAAGKRLVVLRYSGDLQLSVTVEPLYVHSSCP
ncbi:MAG: beta-ketoacyl synthase chain length factor [Ferrovum sp.]|nr:beta-ketoacyl synthase chain length factor [Ferrovum sp.]